VRAELTRARLRALMEELARSAPGGRSVKVYLVGGGTAVLLGWRPSSVDADLFSDDEDVFRQVQEIKERLDVNIELTRPEHFVPPLPGSEERHVFIETIVRTSFYHYDPYAQVLAKVVRGFGRDLDDARNFLRSGLVDPARLRELVKRIPDSAYARYPSLGARAVRTAVEEFLAAGAGPGPASPR
jgi:hypothetical protein